LDEAAEVVVTMPAQPSFLRLARLAAADAGTRAGLNVEEVEDLRLAIDELCGPLMAGSGMVVLRLTSGPGEVQLAGSGPTPTKPQSYPEISEAIVAAVLDEHSIADENSERTFIAKKRGIESN
jgi:serine/threonine-protein kinase RsbW